MSVIDNARAALVQGDLNAEVGVPVSWSEVRALHGVIRDLIAEHERLTAEMHQRELHHFETEALLTQAGIDPDAEPDWEYAVRWVQTEGQPVTDVGADPADVQALVEYQEGYAEGVRRDPGPWLPIHTDGGR